MLADRTPFPADALKAAREVKKDEPKKDQPTNPEGKTVEPTKPEEKK